MSDDTFTQKEILIQLMTDMRETRNEVTSQKLLLMQHIESSNSRDKQITEIKTEIDDIKLKIGALEGFRIRALVIWGFVVFGVTMLGGWVIDKLIK